MGKSMIDLNITTEKEFASLAEVLTITADDAVKCLKMLKKNLSEYDSRYGNFLLHTATVFMRSDIRNAKDVSLDLKIVARQIHESHGPSKAGVRSARKTMNVIAQAMDVLIVTARSYDEKYWRSTGIKGAIENAVHGKDEIEKDENGGLFGKSDNQGEYCGGSILSRLDTVETLVKTTLNDNFNLNVLSYQVNAAEKSLSSFSIVERAKEAVHDVKDKLTGKSSATYAGHGINQSVVP